MKSTAQNINVVIAWLQSQGLPVLPVAPVQNAYQDGNYKIIKESPSNNIWRHCPLDNQFKPVPKFTGKNPSYINPSGLCQLVNHRAYQSRLPSNKEIELWYANSANGIGTLGGWNNTIWLDFDTKQFCDQDACDTAVLDVCGLIKSQTGQEPFLEKSHSGGWHIGVRVNQKPNFTNFTLTEGGKHVGEALGEGRFVVLAPTIGPSGKSYESINRCNLPVVESLESIGIYAAKGLKNVPLPEDKVPSGRINIESYVPNAIPLESLGNELSRQILNGANPTGDRSQSLTTAVKEWYGWENWAKANNITYSGTTEQLAEYAGGRLGLDDDRTRRILKTIDPDQCHPAALSRGSEESCWKKIRRLSRGAYEAYCPSTVKMAFQVLGSVARPPQAQAQGKVKSSQKISESGLVFAITEILEQGLSEPEQREQLIQLAQAYSINRTDVEAIAKEIQVHSDRIEDLEVDSKQFRKLVTFRNQDLDLFKIFPKPLAQALLSKAESSRLDPIRLVQNLLPAGGTMLGSDVLLIAKYGATMYDHWYEAPIFWCADVSAPSSGKTDAQRAVFSALKYIESKEYARVDQAQKQLAQLEAKWKLIPKEEKPDLIGTEADPDYFKKNNIDNLRRYLWDEVTTEALFKLISKQPENSGSCLLKDELEGLFLGVDQFKQGKGNGIQQLLSAWGGPLTGSVDRVDETKSYRFKQQCLNLCGSIQPEVAQLRLNVSNDPDGFTSRMLFGMSKLPDDFTKWSDVQVDLFNCIKGLLQGLEQMSGTLEYSPAAYKLAASHWETLKKGYLHYLELNPAYAYFLGKQNSYIHRFALLLHCIEHYYDPKPNFNVVCIGTLHKAIALSDYYCGQFRILQATSAKPDEPHLDGLLYRVWEKVKSMGKFSTRQLCHFARRQKWRGEKMTAAAALDILKVIEGCGFGVLKDKTLYFQGSPPTPPVPPVPPDPAPTESQQQLYVEPAQEIVLPKDDTSHLTAQLLVESSFEPIPEVVPLVTEVVPLVTPEVTPEVIAKTTEVLVDESEPETETQTQECGQCGQVLSDCPHPQTEAQCEIDSSVVNCGQVQDTSVEPQMLIDVVEEEVIVLEPLLEQSSSTSPDDQELDQPNTDVVDAVQTVEPVENSVVEPAQSPIQESAQEIVVGSVVLWPNCPGHWERWSPFVVEIIHPDGMVKLDIARPDFLVHISELRRVH